METEPAEQAQSPAARAIEVNGITLAFWEWEGAPSNAEPPLIFAHATGFHGRVFDAVIEHFPNRRVLSLDLRGHGRSQGEEITHWGDIAADINGFIDQLNVIGAIGIGHSMGAHALLQVAHDRPSAFAQLVLFDPVVLAPEYYIADPDFTDDAPHPASRRKREFASPVAMMERFGSRDPYCLFDPRVFRDYCQFGLTPTGAGSGDGDGDGMELACAPEVEASVYASSRSNSGILDTVRAIEVPVLVIRAKQTGMMDFKSSPTWPDLASIMPNGTDLYRPDRTHFHPFEDPADAARIIKQACAG
ncbi:MAG: alpha/beta hydrolase [Erythrobacter sp.]